MFFLLFILVFFQIKEGKSQCFDDFSDGNLYQDPLWLGDTLDFIFEEDLLNAYVLAAESDNKEILGEAVNITNGESVSIRDLAEKIRKITGYSGEIQWNSFPKRALEIPKLNMDNAKVKRILNWSPKFSLDDGLKITASYYMK